MTDKAPVTVEQGDRFLLVKRGLYYRPGNQGYTGIKDRAGRYPESDASPEDGITAIHEDDAPEYSQACFADLKEKHMLGKIAALEEEIKRLRADRDRLDFLDRCNERLNAHCGTTYRWSLIMNHNVNRLMLGHMDVDLHDSAPPSQGLPSCRDAIDREMERIEAARSARAALEGRGS